MPDGSEDPGARRRTDWTGIPSDVPLPVRTCMNRVNGRDYSGSTTFKFIFIGVWSNGNSTDFDSVVLGSSPSTPSKF
jgi:hypothetical protein